MFQLTITESTSQLIISVLGGLALFIFGMQLMGDGLQKVAGVRMRSVLRLFAKNRIVAIITGSAVTSVIQSSCATTVMVVGFVNAGLLSLQQSIGIILGAHIGTTITGQLVAFKISWIIMPAIILGLILNFITKRGISHWGTTVLGFGMLFLGMDYMSGRLRELSGTEAVTNIFRTFCCEPVNGSLPLMPLLGAIMIGIIVTFVIQSSSACSGIAIVLASSGLLDFYTATAITLGSNIGTTITALIAAIPANRVAKQAALSHTLTSSIGVLLFILTAWITCDGMPVFFKLVKICSPGATIGRELANANTLFNVISTLLFIPFIGLIAKLCEKIIPVAREDVRFQRLEPHLLATPAIALAQTTAALRKMLQKAWKMVDCSLCIYNKNDELNQRLVKQLEKREADVDERQRDIAEYLAKLMQRPLTQNQARQIPMLLHCTNDAERIGDHTAIIRDIMENLHGSKLRFSHEAEVEFNYLHEQLALLAEAVINLLEKSTPEGIAHAKALKAEISDKLMQFETEHLHRISSGLCVPEVGIKYLDILEEIRKISRHLSNITDRADSFYDKIAKLGKLPLETMDMTVDMKTHVIPESQP